MQTISFTSIGSFIKFMLPLFYIQYSVYLYYFITLDIIMFYVLVCFHVFCLYCLLTVEKVY